MSNVGVFQRYYSGRSVKLTAYLEIVGIYVYSPYPSLSRSTRAQVVNIYSRYIDPSIWR